MMIDRTLFNKFYFKNRHDNQCRSKTIIITQEVYSIDLFLFCKILSCVKTFRKEHVEHKAITIWCFLQF